MKVFIGIFSSIIVLTGATLTVLALWGITPIEWTHIWKTGVTIAIVCVTSLIMWLLRLLFLKKEPTTENK